MAKFKSGDLVQLKSGGPKMTVHGYSAVGAGVESKTVVCKWFAGAKADQATFNEEMLVPVEDEPKK